MVNDILERRRLELLIRRSEAEEHALERGLVELELDQRRTRRSIETRLADQPWHRFVG